MQMQMQSIVDSLLLPCCLWMLHWIIELGILMNMTYDARLHGSTLLSLAQIF
jgi:hypothetical protein